MMLNNKTGHWTTIFAIALIVLDASTVVSMLAAENTAAVFDIWMRMFFPCGILIGTTVLLHNHARAGKKAVAGVTIGLLAFFLIMHIFALCVQLTDSGLSAVLKDTNELLAYIEFIGYIVLLVSNLFLMVHLLSGKLRKTTLVLFCLSGVLLLGGWVAILVGYIRTFSYDGSADFAGFIGTYIDWGFIYAVLDLIAYALVYFTVLKLSDEKKVERSVRAKKEKA